MGKPTVKQLRKDVAELLELKAAYERYRALEKTVKTSMTKLKHKKCIVDQGRVFISQSERVTVPVAVAVDVLGESLANKISVTRRSVSNDIVKAFVAAGEIDKAQRERLLERANRKPVTNLHVRPLT